MHIEHVAIWTSDLERLARFYTTYFQATSGAKNVNPRRGFASYFLTFGSGRVLDLMS